jgi:hypothetical protein
MSPLTAACGDLGPSDVGFRVDAAVLMPSPPAVPAPAPAHVGTANEEADQPQQDGEDEHVPQHVGGESEAAQQGKK